MLLKKFVVVAVCFGSIAGSRVKRVTNGNLVSDMSKFKYMAAYGRADPARPGKYVITCGGAIVGKQHVLTARHCVYEWDVFLGELLTKNATEDLSHANIFTGFNLEQSLQNRINLQKPVIGRGGIRDVDEAFFAGRATLKNWRFFGEKKEECQKPCQFRKAVVPSVHPEWDLALYTLDEEWDWTDTVGPIEIANARTEFYGYGLHISGWGRQPELKRTMAWGIVHEIECPPIIQDAMSAARKYHEKHHTICANNTNGPITCGGDSGGPVVEDRNGTPALVGVVSWGETRCGGAAAYVDITHVKSTDLLFFSGI